MRPPRSIQNILLLSLLVSFSTSPAQDTLRVGDPLLKGAVLPLGTTMFSGSKLEGGVRTPINRSVQSIGTAVEAGIPVYRISNRHWSADGKDTTLTTIIVRRDDLSLIRHKVKARLDSAAVLSAHGILSGWVVLPDQPVQLIDQIISRPVFPVDGPDPWFLSALPLTEGFDAVIPRYSMWKEGEVYEEVHVVGSETLDRNGKKIVCWKIDNGPFAIPGYRAFHWVDKESGKIVQGVLRGKEGDPEYWSVTE